MLPREILGLRSSEIAGNAYFSINFAFSKLSRRATKFLEKGHFAQAFEKWRGHVSPVPPGSYVHKCPTNYLPLNCSKLLL